VKGKPMPERVLCSGEILWDFFSQQSGAGLGESSLFEKRPGGSPFNIAVGLRRLGLQVGFFTCLGGDSFGRSLWKLLEQEGVETRETRVEKQAQTTLAFAALDAHGKPDFAFYRENAADQYLSVADAEKVEVDRYSFFQFGSIAILHEKVREAIFHLVQRFAAAGKAVGFDPNVRPALVKDREAYHRAILSILPMVDLVKCSDDDLGFLYPAKRREGTGWYRETVERWPTKPGALVVVTRGKQGADAFFQGNWTEEPGFSVAVKETTGCGDAFMAGLIFQWGSRFVAGLSYDQALPSLQEMLSFANAGAALVATRLGAAAIHAHDFRGATVPARKTGNIKKREETFPLF